MDDSPSPPPVIPDAPVLQCVIAGLLGAGVALGFALVPLHLITVPMCPFVGGVFAGSRARANGVQAMMISGITATTLFVAIATIAFAIMMVSNVKSMIPGVEDQGMVAVIAMGFF